jgi:hypothetical protein
VALVEIAGSGGDEDDLPLQRCHGEVEYIGSADGVACNEKKYGKKGYHKFIILCVWKIYEKK